LTWRATGDKSRSACTVTCKWTYLAHEDRWDPTYFEAIGLGDLCENDFARIGRNVVAPGTGLGQGLTAAAAADLGLSPGTPVAAGLIDAHAGGVGTIGATGASPEARMAYVFGTSACTMSSSTEKAFVPGVWGPYFNAMVPGLWLSEGGQSAAGEAIAHLLKLHPEHDAFQAAAAQRAMSLPDDLAAMVTARDRAAPDTLALAGQLLVVPEFLGNRAPFADPDARGIVAGLALTSDLDSLIGLYVAGIFGLGYGLRQILDAQRTQGIAPGTVVISGGAARHGVVKQMLADAANIPVAAPDTDEPVLLGSAMLGALASGTFASLDQAMAAMSRLGDIHAPSAGTAHAHAARYDAFTALQAAARQLREDTPPR
ncbi:MAG: FGGY family pentulose kinase, partial [Pseudomonadota bacterium]